MLKGLTRTSKLIQLNKNKTTLQLKQTRKIKIIYIKITTKIIHYNKVIYEY